MMMTLACESRFTWRKIIHGDGALIYLVAFDGFMVVLRWSDWLHGPPLRVGVCFVVNELALRAFRWNTRGSRVRDHSLSDVDRVLEKRTIASFQQREFIIGGGREKRDWISRAEDFSVFSVT